MTMQELHWSIHLSTGACIGALAVVVLLLCGVVIVQQECVINDLVPETTIRVPVLEGMGNGEIRRLPRQDAPQISTVRHGGAFPIGQR